MAASFVADLFAVTTNVTSSTTMTATTTSAVSAGDSAIIAAGARGGTTTSQACSISGLPGDAVVETSPNISNTGSPAVQMFRVYFPTGMSNSTTITFTWVQSATRKEAAGQIITGLANSNGIWQTANPGGTANLTAGTTAATSTTTGWHAAAWNYNSTSGTLTVTPGSDVGGTMTERADNVCGASQFNYIYMEDRAVSASTSGETATATISSAAASSVGVQGVWDGAAANQTVSPPAATANASAPVPGVNVTVPPPAATASASAPTPTVQLKVSPAAATASASAPTPVPQLRVSPAAATANASAPIPSVSAGQTVAPPAATASASAPTPTLAEQIPPPAATANASAPIPGVALRVSPAAASASASSPTPGIALRVSPAAASANASAPVPIVSTAPVVQPSAATAAASALAPTPQLRVLLIVATSSASAPIPGVSVATHVGAAPPRTRATRSTGRSRRTNVRTLLLTLTPDAGLAATRTSGSDGQSFATGVNGKVG